MKTRFPINAIAVAFVITNPISPARAASPEAAYGQSFQMPYGNPATFFVTGPATGAQPDVEGDATLVSVEYPSGGSHPFFYKPTSVTDVAFTGDAPEWRVIGGANTNVGVSGVFPFSDYENGQEDQFADLLLTAFNNSNLNNLVDLRSSTPRFWFTIAFDYVVKDNDPGPDDFGEILYFERGAGSGNSWLKIQALDETGTPLGPWLVVSPNETVQTTPVTTIQSADQTMGTTSIDVSRLGVSEFRYLRVSNDVTGEPAYTGGGDLAPDFKIMAVITNEAQLELQVLGSYD